MSQYLIHWKSLDPKVTTSLFASGALAFQRQETDNELVSDIVLPQKVKLVYSVHVIGEPQGFVLLEATPEEIHQLVLAIPPGAMEFQVYSVIDDAGAKTAMHTRSSEYKLK